MNNHQNTQAMLAYHVGDDLKIYKTETLDAQNSQTAGLSCWNYWQNQYYPGIIRESYPVYIQERATDKGKQAFEIIKTLQDKKLIKLDKVSDFIDAMDTLIKIL